jgi:hypothetical protein
LSSALLAVITQPRSLGQCTLRSRYPLRVSGFQYVPQDACLKLDFSQYPDLPGYPSHVSISWTLPQALASFGCAQDKPWDILLRHGIRLGRLLLHKAKRARDGFPRSVYPFCVALGGCFTPGSLRAQSCAAWHARPGTNPLWACLSLVGHGQRRQDVPDDASSHLHLRSA